MIRGQDNVKSKEIMARWRETVEEGAGSGGRNKGRLMLQRKGKKKGNCNGKGGRMRQTDIKRKEERTEGREKRNGEEMRNALCEIMEGKKGAGGEREREREGIKWRG